MDVTKPYKLSGFGAMDVTKPYKLIGFGAVDVTKPYKLTEGPLKRALVYVEFLWETYDFPVRIPPGKQGTAELHALTVGPLEMTCVYPESVREPTISSPNPSRKAGNGGTLCSRFELGSPEGLPQRCPHGFKNSNPPKGLPDHFVEASLMPAGRS